MRLSINKDTADSYREQLTAVRNGLGCMLDAGHDGFRLAETWSRAVSDCLSAIYNQIFPAETGRHLNVIAVGGFGRWHLAPYSDIDLLLFHFEGRGLEPLIARFERMLWDSGLRPGMICHTPETLRPAMQEMHTATALIQTRLLAGEAGLYKQFQNTRAVGFRCVHALLVKLLLKDMQTEPLSALRELNSLQPDLKHDRFMCRDVQRLAWLAALRQPPDIMPEFVPAIKALGSEIDADAVLQAYAHLLKIRTVLHLQAGRQQNLLDYFSQQKLALTLGCRATSALRPEEVFLQELYQHSRQVFQAVGALRIRRCLKAVSSSRARPEITPVSRRLIQVDGQLRLRVAAAADWGAHPEPLLLLEPFVVMAVRKLKLNQTALDKLRQAVPVMKDTVAARRRAAPAFRRILGSRQPIGQVLLQMHFCGLLEKLLPGFGALACTPQFDVYHQYTTDAHSLLSVCELDKLAQADTSRGLERYRLIFYTLPNPAVLRFAALMHDCGKVLGSPHAVKGASVAKDNAVRLGFSAGEAAQIEFLVREHLLLGEASNHRDISAPGLLMKITGTVADEQNLNALLLLTFADMRTVAAGVWTNWREERLWALYSQVRNILLDAGHLEKNFDREFALYQARARAGLPPSALSAHIQLMDWPEYTASVPFARITGHAEAAVAHQPGSVQVTCRELENAVRILIVSDDRRGLFSDLAGALTGVGLNILQGACYTRRDGLVIDEFEVLPARAAGKPSDAACRKAETLIQEVLAGRQDAAEVLRRRQRTYPDSPAHPGLKVRVNIDMDASEHYTVIDVRAPDRTGLLFALAEAMEAAGIDIRFVKIATHAGQAADSFYVLSPDAKPLPDNTAASLRRHLETAAGQS